MSNVASNAAAVLFIIGGLLGLVSLVTKEGPVLLAVGLLLACIAGMVVTLS